MFCRLLTCAPERGETYITIREKNSTGFAHAECFYKKTNIYDWINNNIEDSLCKSQIKNMYYWINRFKRWSTNKIGVI